MPDTRRYYLPSSGSAAVSPAYGALWDVTGEAQRHPMSETPANTTMSTKQAQEAVTTSPLDVLRVQYVGPNDLPAGEVSGTFQAAIGAHEGPTSAADGMLQCRIAVYSADGLTHRGDLFAGQTATAVSAVSTDPNYELPLADATRLLSGSFSGVTAQAGDRIVIELGWRSCNISATTRIGYVVTGDLTTRIDFPFTVDVAPGTTYRSWVELVLDDPISPPNVPTSLSVTPSPDGTELELDWSAPSGGDPADGYDVRIDGGSATDVGNVFTHDFTGLTPGTAHTLEVRAYNAAGDSAWASIGGTTTAPPGTPTGLVETVLSGTSVELDWTASTGSPDGYEVRVDGGTATDIGNVLTHTFTGLYPGSSPLLEVRAYNEAGYSAWASVEPDTPPATESEYTAVIELGDHAWTIVSGECEDEDVVILDGLRIAWNVDESKPWPAQPEAVQCTLSVWVEDVADFADVGIGTPLSVVLTDVADNVFGTFHGRIAREGAAARKGGPSGLGMLYSLSAVDYTVDLAETPITVTEEWPAESADDRFLRIALALANAGIFFTPPADTGTAAFEAYSATTTDGLTLVMSHLDQIAIDNGEGPQRYLLVPVVDAGTLTGFECVLMDRSVDAELLPGVLDVVDGVLVLTFPDLDADGIVDACNIPLDVPWNRLKYRAVTHVTTAGQTVTGTAQKSGAPVRLNLQTTLTDQTAADLMAALYLPDAAESDGWLADTFTLHAYRDPGAIVPAWFPDHRNDPAETTVYVMPLAVVGIANLINLSGDLGVYAGQLAKVDLRLEDQKVYVDFGLRRQLPESDGADALTWDDVATLWPTLTWDDVDPGLSWYDARLGKAP